MGLFMARHQLDREQVFLASGSNEGLQAAMMAFGKHGKVISPTLTYSDHLQYAEKLGVAVHRVPLRDDMAIDCLLYTSPSPRDGLLSRMPSSA